jgi:hypothetical protein
LQSRDPVVIGKKIMSMLRITEVSTGRTEVSLRLEENWLDMDTGERICLYHRDEKNKTVVLDFSGVTFIHKKGVRMLESIKHERVELINCSPFIESLLFDLIIKDNK